MNLNQFLHYYDLLLAKQRVYQALTVRHMMMRFGRDNIGFLWIVVEPMLLCLGVMVIWSLSKSGTEHGVQITAMVYTGYMPLTLWRHQSNMVLWIRSARLFTQYRNITIEDILFSRIIMEFITVTAAAIIVYLVLNSFSILPDIYDFNLLIEGWLLMGALGFSGGLIIAGLSEISEITEKIIPPLQYFLIPISGSFYMLDWLPDKARDLLLYVPFQHAYEVFRAGYFGPSVRTYGTPSYAFLVALVALGVGLALLILVKRRLHP